MRVKLWIVLFLMLGLLAACGQATPTPTPAPAPGVPTPTTPTPRATPAPSPATPTALVPTGELRIATSYAGVEVLDPTLGPASGSKNFLAPIYDYLVGATLEGALSKELGLARDWEVSHGPKSSTYTFYLRQGVKWHNGDEVTAEDVKFSLEYFQRPASVASLAGTLRTSIDRIETPERYKVVVHTKQPYGLLVTLLSPIMGAEGMVLPKKYLEQVGEAKFNISPMGSGPYRFKEEVIGSYLRYEAAGERHFRWGVPKFKTITFFVVPEETTRIAMLKTGQADVADVSRERLKELTDLKSFLKPGSEEVFIQLHNTWQADTFLYDKRVREALNLAINREEILKFLFEGQGQVVGHARYGSWALGYKPLPLYPYDPDRAKALLREAAPGGVSLTVNSYTRPGVSELQRMNEAVASLWEKVGVKTKIVSMDYGTQRAKWGRGDLPNTVSGQAMGNQPLWGALWRTTLHSTGLLTLAKIPELDALIEAAETELDPQKLGEREFTVAKYLRDNHLLGPMLETGALYAANPKKVTQWNMGKLWMDNNFLDLVRR